MPVVLYEKKGKTAYITLNRPEAMNALSLEVWRAVVEAWIQVRDDPDVWTAIVTGAGDRAFSAGADLKEMSELHAQAEKEGRPFSIDIPRISPMMGNLDVYKPFIAAIQGYCLAGGLEIALCCDIRVAAENASFGFAEVTRAIIPGAGGTQRLPRAIPFGIALELMITGDRINAQEAYRLGLVNKVVPVGQHLAVAEAIANKINENGPLAVRAIKEAAYKGINMTLEQGLRLENLLSFSVHQTADSKEGPTAFAQKRKPEYKAG